MGVLFALRQWKRVHLWEGTLWYILGRNHSNVNSVTSLAIKNQILDYIWKFTKFCHDRKQKYTIKYFWKIHFANKSLSTSLQNDPIKLGAGQYGCPFCPKIMKNTQGIKRHIMIHTGEKPFSCEYCSYTSNRSSNLRSHMKNTHNIIFWK